MKTPRIRIAPGAIRVPIPDATQIEDYSCGASALQSICKYYGVGPEDEWDYVDALGMDKRVGSHAFQVERLAKRLGLRVKTYDPMTRQQLIQELRLRHPVMLMIQAWGEERVRGKWRWRRDYSREWKDGHWVVAIGYDRNGFFFEDPSLQMVRGFLSYAELDARWRDTGPRGVQKPNFGLAIWHAKRSASAYEQWAAPIR